jgi:hypothetical protein
MSSIDHSLEAFSPEWFAHARSLVEGVTLPLDCACRLQFDATGTRWFLTLSGGRVTGWDLGTIDEPDAELRWSAGDARQIVARELRGTAALLATTVVATAADGPYVGPPAPLNLSGRPEIRSMPTASGATFGVQYVFKDGPFGDVDYVQHFVDGRLVEERLGSLHERDVVVSMTYRAMALVRAGEWTVIEALEGGSVVGDLGPLAALAGIAEGPEYHDAELATGPHMLGLAALGELDADPTYAAAVEQLAASTRWS